MRKIITAFLIILCLTAANVYADDITVIMDGEEMSFDQPPVIMNDSTLVPFRAIFERLGMEVEWDSTDKSVIAYNDDTAIGLIVGYDTMFVNDDEVQLIAPPTIINDRTLVPLRAISEAVGAYVGWDGETRTVTINTGGKEAGTQPAQSDVRAEQVLALVNAERAKYGMGPVSWDSSLAAVAEKHCADMIARGFFDHNNPDGETPFDRLDKANIGYWMAGENIAAGQSMPEAAMEDWMNS
ncbi:MAG: hypothetical protein IJH36_10230 [Clostridia bacterium]|nr:hypothetical protein [Clostridia bacterium]